METGFAITALLAVILNLSIAEEVPDAKETVGKPDLLSTKLLLWNRPRRRTRRKTRVLPIFRLFM